MGKDYTHKKAKTIGDILSILTDMKDSGYDMNSGWNGFDDGNIYIHPKEGEWISIDTAAYDD